MQHTQTAYSNPVITPEFSRLFHVSVKKSEGAIAYYAGKSIFDCPYSPTMDQDFYDAWVNSYIETENKYHRSGYLKENQ